MICAYKPDDMLDKQIKAALHNKADEVAVSAGLDEAVWQSIGRAGICRGGGRRLRLFGRRVLITFCALFCLSCCGVVAAVSGGGGGWVSHSGPDWHFSKFSQIASAVKHLEFEPEYLESLAGGYVFQGGYISEMQRLDENGHRMSHVYKDLFLDYVNAQNGESVVLVASNAPRDSFDELRQTVSRPVGEIELVYTTQPYKFVPPGYVLTDEDKAALADGSLEISVGSDEVERMLNVSVEWTQEGVYYHLFGWDLSLTAEEMLDIAADFVERTIETEEKN